MEFIWFLIYGLIGFLLSMITYVNGGKRAAASFENLLLFIIAWPVILFYMLYAIAKWGHLTYKGKTLWRAKGSKK